MAEINANPSSSSEVQSFINVEFRTHFTVVKLDSGADDPTNQLSQTRILELTAVFEDISSRLPLCPLILTGNQQFFSAGADLNEIAAFIGPEAYEFAAMGQRLMNLIDHHSAPVIAAIRGYCMGGGLDIALACDYRIATPATTFGHRGAALGIITGWGGTQRLPRLIGKAHALQMFLAAEKLNANDALRIGLIDGIEEDPLRAASSVAESCTAPVS